MKSIPLILICLFWGLNLSAAGDQELLNDTEFKKHEKFWLLRKTKEYKKLKEEFKSGQFSVTTEHSSHGFYLILFKQVNLKSGDSYLFSCEAKTQGSGEILYEYGSYNDVFSKAKKGKKEKSKTINLGLKEKVIAEGSKWQKVQFEFTVSGEAPQGKKSYLKIHLGEFKGSYQMRQPSIKKLTVF